MNHTFEYPRFETLDDLLKSTYSHIVTNGSKLSGKRGVIFESTNFAVTLNNPRSRTSRSLDRRLVKSKFAEFAWYLSGDSDKSYIQPYIFAYNEEESENNKILGGYGPKIFNADNTELSQFDRIIEQICKRQETKQAYLVISDQKDYKVRLEKHSSPPCTVGLHFLVRDNKLNLTCYMRSNDAYFGLPHDLFCFTMLQELVALRCKIPLGSYSHVCTSMHIYENQMSKVSNYLNEGYFEDILMPNMEVANNETLKLVVQSFGRKKENIDISILPLYWKDYVMFSNRFSQNVSQDIWLKSFHTAEISEIAKCSISK